MIITLHPKRTGFGFVRILWMEIVFTLVYSTMVYVLYEYHAFTFLKAFGVLPVGFFGTILSVFLAFRNSNAYARWWEARTLWGELVNASRMFGTQVLTFIPLERRQVLIYRHLACVHLMRMQLRGTLQFAQIDHYLSPEEQAQVRQSVNPAGQLLSLQGVALKSFADEGCLSDYRQVEMMRTLDRVYTVLGACERIKNTPFPLEYEGFVHALIWIFMCLSPVYFLSLYTNDLSELLIIPSSLAMAIMIGFANKAGELMSTPFENDIHDIPMSALCNTIERDLLRQLGQTDIPGLQQPETDVVW